MPITLRCETLIWYMSHHRPAWGRGIPCPPERNLTMAWGEVGSGESDHSYSWESPSWCFPPIISSNWGAFSFKTKKATDTPNGISEANFQIVPFQIALKESFVSLYYLFLLWDIFKLYRIRENNKTNCHVWITRLQQLWIHRPSRFLSPPYLLSHPIPWVISK